MADRELVEVRVRLSPESHRRLRDLVGGRRMSPTVRTLVEDYLEVDEQRRRLVDLRCARREGRL